MPESSLLALSSNENPSALSPELWLLIMKKMMEGSLTLYAWYSILSVVEPSVAQALKSELRRWLGDNKKPEDIAENFFYSHERQEIYLGKLIYRLRTAAILNGPPECDSKFSSYHSEEYSYYVSTNNIVYSCGLNKLGALGLGHSNPVYVPTPIKALPSDATIKTIATSHRSTFLITHLGQVFVFGNNEFGQLGLGHTNPVFAPTLIPEFPQHGAVETVVTICSTFFITTTKTNNTQKIFACGNNLFGQLGLGHIEQVHAPTPITALPSDATIKTIVTNGMSTFFITHLGQVFVCGDNTAGQLGLGHTNQVNTPTPLIFPDGARIEKIVVNPYRAGEVCFVLFITKTGEVFACGDNSAGQLGLGHTDSVDSPQLIETAKDWAIKDIAIADNYIFFLTVEGKVLSNKSSGIFPVEALKDEIVVKIQDITNRTVRDSSSGLIFVTQNSIIRKFNIQNLSRVYRGVFALPAHCFTTIISFGLFLREGMIGSYDKQIPGKALANMMPEALPTDSNKIVSPTENILYSPERQKVFYNERVCGTAQNSCVYSALPQFAQNPRCFHSAENSFYVIPGHNIVFAEGLNRNGELGLGHTNQVNVLTPITTFPLGTVIKTVVTNDISTFFITERGQVYACGLNLFGPLGLGHTNPVFAPTLIPEFPQEAVETAVTGSGSTFFITKTGKVFACGNNGFGQLGLGHNIPVNTPTLITEVPSDAAIEKIVTNANSTFFITKTGKVFACGYNLYGQLGLGHNNPVNTPTLITEVPPDAAIEKIVTNANSTFFITKTGKVFACGLNFFGALGLGHSGDINVPTLITGFPRDTAIKNIVIADIIAAFFISRNGFVFFSGSAKHFSEDWVSKNSHSIQQIESLDDLVIVQGYSYNVSNKGLLAFVSADGVVLQIGRNETKTLANLRSSMPQSIINSCNRQLEFNRLKKNKSVGWLYGPNNELYTVSHTEASQSNSAQQVFMTQWMLSYPMKELKNTLSRSDITPAEIESAKSKCNKMFKALLNTIDDNQHTQPLVLEHTRKSITPAVIEMASTYLDPNNIRRLISYMSASQTQRWLSFTELALDKNNRKFLRHGWSEQRAQVSPSLKDFHTALLEHQRAKTLPARTP